MLEYNVSVPMVTITAILPGAWDKVVRALVQNRHAGCHEVCLLSFPKKGFGCMWMTGGFS